MRASLVSVLSRHTPTPSLGRGCLRRALEAHRTLVVVVAAAIALAAGHASRAGAAAPVGAAPAAATPSFEPLVVVSEPRTLAAMEAGGLDAGTLAFGGKQATSLAQLAGGAGWASIARVLRADIAEIYAADARYGVGMKYTHRGFDPAWLSSSAVRLELVAVVNRIDRRVFHPGRAVSCASSIARRTRLPTRIGSRRGCRSRSTSCSSCPTTANAARAARARWRGPMTSLPSCARALTLKSVEVNLQTSRWPSTIRPDLGGHADYLLRVFHAGPGRQLRRRRRSRTCPTSIASSAIRRCGGRWRRGCGRPACWQDR